MATKPDPLTEATAQLIRHLRDSARHCKPMYWGEKPERVRVNGFGHCHERPGYWDANGKACYRCHLITKVARLLNARKKEQPCPKP